MASNVLILGAGASRHHDFPVSREIWTRICLNRTDLSDGALRGVGLDPDAFENFAERLAQSGVLSVDAFAEYVIDDPDDLYMAKGLIAYTLGIYEIRASLRGRDRDWYRTLANILIGLDLDSFPRRDIAIITFNYERSLERYLLDCLQGRFIKKHSLEEIVAAFRRMPIIHIYGQMGALPDFQIPRAPVCPYDRISNPTQLRQAVSGMHLLPEIKRDDRVGNRDAARMFIKDATGSVTFLGFAYDPENLRALDLANTCGGKPVSGTTFGFGPDAPIDSLNRRMHEITAGHWSPFRPDRDVFAALEAHPDRILGVDRGAGPPAIETTSIEPDVV